LAAWIFRASQSIRPSAPASLASVVRFPVARLLGLLAAGETQEAILASFPYLEPEDIGAALRYAAFLAEDETLELPR
jgi:hypothetical protein